MHKNECHNSFIVGRVPYSGKFFVCAKFHGVAIQSFRRNFSVLNFAPVLWQDHSRRQLANTQCATLKFTWFLFSHQLIYL